MPTTASMQNARVHIKQLISFVPITLHSSYTACDILAVFTTTSMAFTCFQLDFLPYSPAHSPDTTKSPQLLRFKPSDFSAVVTPHLPRCPLSISTRIPFPFALPFILSMSYRSSLSLFLKQSPTHFCVVEGSKDLRKGLSPKQSL
jgi:hypothetical protein